MRLPCLSKRSKHSWSNKVGCTLAGHRKPQANKQFRASTRPLQIAYKTALSESLILSTILKAYISAPFTQSTLHTIHVAYRCITINIAYGPKISHFQDGDRLFFYLELYFKKSFWCHVTRTYFVQWPAAKINLLFFLLASKKKSLKKKISTTVWFHNGVWPPKGDSKYKEVHLSLWFHNGVWPPSPPLSS